MSENPYAPPVIREDASPDGVDRSVLREIVVGWEKLRFWYNALLLLPGLGVGAIWVSIQGLGVASMFALAVLVAIGANVCFCLGPLAELYLRGILTSGRPLGRGRRLIFGAGMVVSLGIFAIFAGLGMITSPAI